MNRKPPVDAGAASSRTTSLILLWVGVMLVAAAAALVVADLFRTVAVPEGAVSLLLLGIGSLIVSNILPKMKSLKLGKDGVDIDLQDLSQTMNDQIVALTARVGALEVAKIQPSSERRAVAATTPIEWKEAPEELDLPGEFVDDPRRGRFGGSPVGEGMRLDASFGRYTADWSEVVLTVEPIDAGARSMADVPAVEFFLHDSFPTKRLKTPVVDGKAKLSLTCWGGFTVGVWVPARAAVLELNLATVSGAPAVIRTR